MIARTSLKICLLSIEIRDTHQKLVKVFRESDRFEKWRKGKERRKRLVNYCGHVSAIDSWRSFLLSGRGLEDSANRKLGRRNK